MDDGEFFVAPTKKGVKNNKRVYIGGLPNTPDVEQKLRALLLNSGFEDIPPVIELNGNGKSQHTFLDCGEDSDLIIHKLNQFSFEGSVLTVQREQKKGKQKQQQQQKHQQKYYHGKKKPPAPSNKAFGTWSAPKILSSKRKSTTTTAKAESQQTVSAAAPIAPSNQHGEPPSALNIAQDGALADMSSPTEQSANDIGDFRARCAVPLSSLLEDFGEQDLDWKKVEPLADNTAAADAKVQDGDEEEDNDDEAPGIDQAHEEVVQENESRLSRHGRAPVHVEFSSFGYSHGAPKEIRNGWSHSQPLAAKDCREFPEAPDYLQWQDGKSNAVRKSLLQFSSGEIRKFATAVASETFGAIKEAQEAGYGFALPLNMTVYLASESGRHRSVLCCEMSASALRKLLRNNENNAILEPVSVGTHHAHINRRKKQPDSKRKTIDKDEVV